VSPPLFIVACDRSGTTLLRLILDRGPQIAIPTESMILADFGHRRESYGALDTDAQFDRLAADIWRHPKVAEWKLTEPPPHREGRTGEDAYRAALAAPFEAYARERGKPRWGDKTPYYINCVDELKRVFPEARIVNLVRDGRDVCLSLLRVPFGPANVWAAAHQWKDAVDRGDAAHARYGDDVLTVSYEQMVRDPQAQIGRICEFAGLSFAPEMLEADPNAGSRVAAGQESWFTGLSAGINADSVDAWRTRMTRSDQALFVSIAGEALRRHGYETPDTGPPPRTPDSVQLAHNWSLKLWQFTKLHVVQERGREVPHIIRRTLSRS
jgi:hypothetical protein